MEQGDADRDSRFDALYEAHFSDIASYCRWRSRTEGDAEEAVAEVFAILWRRLDEAPDDGLVRAWLYATARRVTANQLRGLRRHASLLERLRTPQITPSVEDVLIGDDPTSDLVRRALRTLRTADQEVLLLAEWQELSSAEIAKVVGCRVGTARGRLHRARGRFRAAFEPLSGAVESEQGSPSLEQVVAISVGTREETDADVY